MFLLPLFYREGPGGHEIKAKAETRSHRFGSVVCLAIWICGNPQMDVNKKFGSWTFDIEYLMI